MTNTQVESLKKELVRLIPILARNHEMYNDEVLAVMQDFTLDNDEYIPVTWPESQELMTHEDFNKHCFLINDDEGIQKFGSSAYFCNKMWLNSLTNV